MWDKCRLFSFCKSRVIKGTDLERTSCSCGPTIAMHNGDGAAQNGCTQAGILHLFQLKSLNGFVRVEQLTANATCELETLHFNKNRNPPPKKNSLTSVNELQITTGLQLLDVSDSPRPPVSIIYPDVTTEHSMPLFGASRVITGGTCLKLLFSRWPAGRLFQPCAHLSLHLLRRCRTPAFAKEEKLERTWTQKTKVVGTHKSTGLKIQPKPDWKWKRGLRQRRRSTGCSREDRGNAVSGRENLCSEPRSSCLSTET